MPVGLVGEECGGKVTRPFKIFAESGSLIFKGKDERTSDGGRLTSRRTRQTKGLVSSVWVVVARMLSGSDRGPDLSTARAEEGDGPRGELSPRASSHDLISDKVY